MNTIDHQTNQAVDTPARLQKHADVLPVPSPIEMPHQNLEVSPAVKRVWRWVHMPGQFVQQLLARIKRD